MQHRDIIISAVSLILGIIGSWYFYVRGTIDDLQSALDQCHLEKSTLEADVLRLKDRDDELILEIRKAEIENEYKLKEISLREENIHQLEEEKRELEFEIKTKEERIAQLYQDMNQIIQEGASEEVRTKLEEQFEEIRQLNDERKELLASIENLNEQIKQLTFDKLAVEKELEMVHSVEIPGLEGKIDRLEADLELANHFVDFMNIRANVSDLSVDKRANALSFVIEFNDKDYQYLLSNEAYQQYTFSPKIINKTQNLAFMPNLNDFDVFTKRRTSLNKYVELEFPVGNFDFKGYRNGSRGVNFEKGDEIHLQVVVDEISDLVVVDQVFYIQ